MIFKVLVACLISTPVYAAPIILQLSDDHKNVGGMIHQMAPKSSVSTHSTLVALVQEAATTYNIDPYLIIAIIHTESNFTPHARSPKGAIGLMQVMPATARQYGHYDLYQPKDNIMVGTRHFSYLMRRYGSISHALAAYNAGQGNVDKYQGIPPFSETQAYVKKVLASYATAQRHGKSVRFSVDSHTDNPQPSQAPRNSRPIVIDL